MHWDPTIRISDILIAIATLSGPIAALWILRKLNVEREQRARRVEIVRRLMVTRSGLMATDHVDSLNAVPIEFYGISKVQTKFAAYLKRLNTPAVADAAWGQKR